MNEYSRIIIETYCDKYKTDSRFKMLAKLVKRSYKIDAEYESDAEANFIFDFIEHCAVEDLRKALIDLDEFLIGKY
jgi:hypothetical protein